MIQCDLNLVSYFKLWFVSVRKFYENKQKSLFLKITILFVGRIQSDQKILLILLPNLHLGWATFDILVKKRYIPVIPLVASMGYCLLYIHDWNSEFFGQNLPWTTNGWVICPWKKKYWAQIVVWEFWTTNRWAFC